MTVMCHTGNENSGFGAIACVRYGIAMWNKPDIWVYLAWLVVDVDGNGREIGTLHSTWNRRWA